jgi:septation ring formation regulator EzrA
LSGMGRLQKLEQSNVALNNALQLMIEKVGSIQALHDHFQRTQVEVMDKVSSMQSWMTKFDNNLSTINGLLSRFEPLLPGS